MESPPSQRIDVGQETPSSPESHCVPLLCGRQHGPAQSAIPFPPWVAPDDPESDGLVPAVPVLAVPLEPPVAVVPPEPVPVPPVPIAVELPPQAASRRAPAKEMT